MLNVSNAEQRGEGGGQRNELVRLNILQRSNAHASIFQVGIVSIYEPIFLYNIYQGRRRWLHFWHKLHLTRGFVTTAPHVVQPLDSHELRWELHELCTRLAGDISGMSLELEFIICACIDISIHIKLRHYYYGGLSSSFSFRVSGLRT